MSVRANRLLPLVGVEFGSNIQVPSQQVNPLVIGMTNGDASVTAQDGKIYQVTNIQEAYLLFGYGSQLALILEGYFLRGDVAVDVLAFKPGASDKATSVDLSVSGMITKAGNIAVDVAGTRYITAFASSDMIEDALKALSDKINADKTGAFTTSVTPSTTSPTKTDAKITFLSKGKGWYTKILDGEVVTEITSSELTFTKVKTAGSGEIDGAKIVAALGEKHYNLLIHNLPSAMDVIHTELKNRWDITSGKEGMQFLVAKDTYSNLYARQSKNQMFTCMVAMKGQATGVSSERILGEITREIYEGVSIDPSAPVRNMALSFDYRDNFSDVERELLLEKGYSTVKQSNTDKAVIESLVTTYRTSDEGLNDLSFLYINTFFTLSAIRYETASHFINVASKAKYIPKLTSTMKPGQKIITNDLILTEMIALFIGGTSDGLGDFVGKGWAQNFNPRNDIKIETVNDSTVKVYFNANVVKPLNVFHGVVTYK